MEDLKQYLKLINNCDSWDPLLSQTPLGKCLGNIPLSSVVKSDLNYMTLALNPEQLIPTETGLARDYRGLAELMGFNSIETENCIKRSYNPTRSLIDAFINTNKAVTLNELLKLIEKIERFDVIDDMMPILIRLASNNHQQLQTPDNNINITSKNDHVKPPITSNHLSDFDRLTIDDRSNSEIIIYDAFICYAPEDLEYAKELIDLLETNNKTVTIADDLLPGHFEHDALVRLIDTRCRRVIIILTPNFSRSKECEFQTKFASEIGIKADSPKIIPVLYEACDDSILPSMIKVLSKIDMTNQSNREWQLHRLLRSLGNEESQSTITRLGSARNSMLRNINTLMVTDTRNTPSPRINQAHGSETIPAITFMSDAHSSNSQNLMPPIPIVDVIQSENSSDLSLRQASNSSGSNHPIARNSNSPNSTNTTSSSNPLKWLKRVWRNETDFSNNSRSNLISSDYTDEK